MRKFWRQVLKVLGWPYLYHLIALAGCAGALIDVETGHPLSHADQVWWLALTAAWVGINALTRHTYEMAKKTGENWRKLYELAAQKKRSIWS